MRHKILLPTDFSDNAWSAIVYASKLYANKSCTFYLLHSWSFSHTTSRTFITTHYIDETKEASKKQLIKLKEQVESANTNTNHKFQVVFSEAPLLEAVKATIKEHDIDLLVMGTKGATKTKGFFFGSNTVDLINKMKLCPILVVPDELDFVKPKLIAFPTDYSRTYTDKDLQSLKDLADLYDSKIIPVSILTNEKLTTSQDENKATLEKHLKNHNTDFHFIPNNTKKHAEINLFIKQQDINILVMVNYKHSIIEDIVKEPVINKIGYQPLIPFLVIPD